MATDWILIFLEELLDWRLVDYFLVLEDAVFL
jgi:hypothetical protein